ncbi:MAG: class I SAM-dependent methyltransferase, partial [Pseudomonadota bacterium]
VLDAGCGTGLVAASLPSGIEVDGIDLSPDMLAVAGQRDRYRALIEADLTSALPFENETYRGLVSSGTFTHGHVGPEALQELLRCLTSGAIAALSTNATYMEKTGFRDSLVTLAASGRIGDLELSEERIYADPDGAPEGHGEDMGFIVTFRRL